jgi:hypothetical protein
MREAPQNGAFWFEGEGADSGQEKALAGVFFAIGLTARKGTSN